MLGGDGIHLKEIQGYVLHLEINASLGSICRS